MRKLGVIKYQITDKGQLRKQRNVAFVQQTAILHDCVLLHGLRCLTILNFDF